MNNLHGGMIQSPYCNIHVSADYSYNNTHAATPSHSFFLSLVSDHKIVVNFITFQNVSVKRTTAAAMNDQYVFIRPSALYYNIDILYYTE